MSEKTIIITNEEKMIDRYYIYADDKLCIDIKGLYEDILNSNAEYSDEYDCKELIHDWLSEATEKLYDDVTNRMMDERGE